MQICCDFFISAIASFTSLAGSGISFKRANSDSNRPNENRQRRAADLVIKPPHGNIILFGELASSPPVHMAMIMQLFFNAASKPSKVFCVAGMGGCNTSVSFL